MQANAMQRDAVAGYRLHDDEMWTAVVRRDPAADNSFYFSVRTTGVYCRPSCGARRPLRANVLFHATLVDAERAGFRPCKRCRPRDAPLAVRRTTAVASACRMIEESKEMANLGAVATAVGMSPSHFHRVFKASTGVTPRAYADASRADRLRLELTQRATVTEAMHRAGFSSSGRFHEASSRLLGMTPTAFRRGGAGASIRFAVGKCSLGAILVAASDKGVCAILLGDEPGALVRDLRDRYPEATVAGGDAEFGQRVAQVVGFVDNPRLGLDLPLDIRGTAFQQRVWQALAEIPPGETAGYASIAQHIGSPGAARAVAGACAANPLAVAIPCHRVVRADGGISGYRWGIERKRDLLRRESGD